jgi:hypothetical protein
MLFAGIGCFACAFVVAPSSRTTEAAAAAIERKVLRIMDVSLVLVM